MTLEDPREDLFLPGRALPAGSALAARLAGEEPDQPQTRAHGIGGLVHDDDRTGTEHRSGGTHLPGLEGNVQVFAEEPGGRGAAGDEHLELVAVADPCAVTRRLEEVAEGRGALCDLEDARVVDVSRQGDQARAGRGLGACLAEGVHSVLEQPRQVGQRLDVVDHGRLHVQALGGREEGRLQSGHPAVALEGLDQRGLLTDDVGTGAPGEHDVDREVAAEDVAPDEVGLVGLVERRRYALLRMCHLSTHVQEHLCGADRVRRQQAALDELVWIALHEHAVLVGARFRLVTVDHDVAGPDVRRTEAPLHTGWEPRAAAAQQCRLLDDLADLRRGTFQRGAETFVSPVGAAVAVALQGVARGFGEPGRHDQRHVLTGTGGGVAEPVDDRVHDLLPFMSRRPHCWRRPRHARSTRAWTGPAAR